MKKTKEGFLFSASDLSTFTACPHVVTLDIRSYSEELARVDYDEQTQLIQKKGVEHEKRYLQKLQYAGQEVLELSFGPGVPDEEKLRVTDEVLRQGAPVVYQPYFNDGIFHGYADFLFRVERPSKLGNFSYEVADAKVSATEKSSYILQLCCYSELLEKIQGVRPERIHVVLGSNKQVEYRLANYFAYYLKIKNRLLSAVRDGGARGYPEPCQHCGMCQWRNECKSLWEQDDHLSLVATMTKGQAKKLSTVGISTVAALASYDGPAPIRLSTEVFTRLKRQAGLQVKKREFPADNFYQFLEPSPGKTGFALLPEAAQGDLFYDIEGDPLLKDEALKQSNPTIRSGLEYLHGFAWIDESGETHYKAFWALRKSDERRCYEELVDFLSHHIAQHPRAHIYHYSQYEVAALKRLSCQYGSRTEQVDALLREQKFVDLYQVVRQAILVSEPKYSIKNLERFYLEKRTEELKSGGASVVWFEHYLETKDEALLRGIEEYNRVDCISTVELFKWLTRLKSEAEAHFGRQLTSQAEVRLDEQEGKDDDHLREQSPADERLARYWASFAAGLPEDEDEYSDTDKFSALLYYLADFYRREKKPQWWQYHERKSKTPPELMADPDCLGGITLDESIPPEPDKRSLIYTYRFEPQETKLSAKDRVDDLDRDGGFGEIVSIDHENLVVRVKRSKKSEVVKYASLIPNEDIRATKLVLALDRFLRAVADNGVADVFNGGPEFQYSAILDLIRRSKPRTRTPRPGALISATAQDDRFISELCDLAASLNGSYLFIQGPPGTGKTFSGARVAVSLLQRGMRVAVASNSHKGIINFLDEVERVASEANFIFRGVKKSKADEPEQQIKGGLCITNSDKLEVLTAPDVQLVAGTAWALAEDEFHQAFDYLLIDEAGQFSLAHTIATGTVARNIILIGDPMQLSQPTQGIHPAGAGLSPLEHLLNGSATVAPSHGVFLDTSRRMHTDICDFLSEHVYDGRLRASQENSRQRIEFSVEGVLGKTAGIAFVPTDHEGNSHSSVEEAETVEGIYRKLLRGCFRSKDGEMSQLTSRDIIVIAPYNMQVRLLKEKLGPEARVGTIDLFQGQEAPVAIVSMTTSSSDDLPRALEFLFSKQRLNVALSRAKALAIVVACPDLFKTKCSSPEQMALVNTLCALDAR